MKRTFTITLVTMAAAILLAGCRQTPRFWKGADIGWAPSTQKGNRPSSWTDSLKTDGVHYH